MVLVASREERSLSNNVGEEGRQVQHRNFAVQGSAKEGLGLYVEGPTRQGRNDAIEAPLVPIWSMDVGMTKVAKIVADHSGIERTGSASAFPERRMH